MSVKSEGLKKGLYISAEDRFTEMEHIYINVILLYPGIYSALV